MNRRDAENTEEVRQGNFQNRVEKPAMNPFEIPLDGEQLPSQNSWRGATNSYRANRAERTLMWYVKLTGCVPQDALTDLLADLIHWCRHSSQPFDQSLTRARANYEDEKPDSDEDIPPEVRK